MQSRKSLQDKAYEYLKAQIMDGAFEKGKIYSLAAITASLNMSRTPVRDALLSLSQENLVDVLPSRGFQLHEVTRREIIELYQLRCAIEGYCAAFLASCSQPTNIISLIWNSIISLFPRQKISIFTISSKTTASAAVISLSFPCVKKAS